MMVTSYDSAQTYLAEQPTRKLILWLEEWDRIGKKDVGGRDVIVVDAVHFDNRGGALSRGIVLKDEIRRELDHRGHFERIVGWLGSRRSFWQVVHNVVAHPLMETRTDWSYRFHDWTGELAWDEI